MLALLRSRTIVLLFLEFVIRCRGQTTVILNVFERFLHDATVASIIAVLSSTVDQLLHGKRHQHAGLLEVLSLQRSDGRKGPARTAVALIQDRSNGAQLHPVDFLGQMLANNAALGAIRCRCTRDAEARQIEQMMADAERKATLTSQLLRAIEAVALLHHLGHGHVAKQIDDHVERGFSTFE